MTALVQVFGLLFLLVGMGALGAMVLAVKRSRATQSWPSTPGTILRSEKHAVHEGNSENFIADIAFEYVVAGVTYKSTTVRLGAEPVDEAYVDSMLNQFKVGDHVDVYYAPNNPENGILTRNIDAPGITMVAAIGFFFMLGAIVMLAAM